MDATVTVVDGTDTRVATVQKEGIDLFTVPAGTKKVRIDGKGMTRPLEFDFTN
jgi:hypothetical protein